MFSFKIFNTFLPCTTYLRGLDKYFRLIMILGDLQKAFSTLDHTLLLQKMEYNGFKKSVIKWFQLYLPNRNFFVIISLFRCWRDKLWCSTRIYLRPISLPHICKWLTTYIKQGKVIPPCWWYLYLLSR